MKKLFALVPFLTTALFSIVTDYNGTYTGTATYSSQSIYPSDWCESSSNWTFTSNNGSITGTTSNPDDATISGLTVNSTGVISGTTSGGTTWSGQIYSDGSITGTYNYGDGVCVGTFSGLGNPIVSNNSLEQQEAFIERFYQNILNRSADTGGMNTWLDVIQNQSAAKVALGFFQSQEFINLGLSNEQFVDILYQTLFDRVADSGGRDIWLNQLNNGTSRIEVIYGFLNAQEFKNLADSFGVTQIRDIDQITEVPGYVNRFYNLVLNRSADEVGFNDWVSQLRAGTKAGGDIAKGFFNSQEYMQRGLDDSTFLDICYRAFFNREADIGGKNSWLSQIAQGATTDDILNGFIGSQEFIQLAASYGIQPIIENSQSIEIFPEDFYYESIKPISYIGLYSIEFANENVDFGDDFIYLSLSEQKAQLDSVDEGCLITGSGQITVNYYKNYTTTPNTFATGVLNSSLIQGNNNTSIVHDNLNETIMYMPIATQSNRVIGLNWIEHINYVFDTVIFERNDEYGPYNYDSTTYNNKVYGEYVDPYTSCRIKFKGESISFSHDENSYFIIE